MKVIIIGAGEVGYHIADVLSREGIDTVVIDKDRGAAAGDSETLDVQTVVGSGSSPEVLKRAGMANAEMVVAVTDSDETNMIACLLASTQCRNPDPDRPDPQSRVERGLSAVQERTTSTSTSSSTRNRRRSTR